MLYAGIGMTLFLIFTDSAQVPRKPRHLRTCWTSIKFKIPSWSTSNICKDGGYLWQQPLWDLEQILQIIKLILQDSQLILVYFTDVLGDLPLVLHGLLHMRVLGLRAARVSPLTTSQTHPASGGHDLNHLRHLSYIIIVTRLHQSSFWNLMELTRSDNFFFIPNSHFNDEILDLQHQWRHEDQSRC